VKGKRACTAALARGQDGEEAESQAGLHGAWLGGWLGEVAGREWRRREWRVTTSCA
jgi:hypothetical protein